MPKVQHVAEHAGDQEEGRLRPALARVHGHEMGEARCAARARLPSAASRALRWRRPLVDQRRAALRSSAPRRAPRSGTRPGRPSSPWRRAARRSASGRPGRRSCLSRRPGRRRAAPARSPTSVRSISSRGSTYSLSSSGRAELQTVRRPAARAPLASACRTSAVQIERADHDLAARVRAASTRKSASPSFVRRDPALRDCGRAGRSAGRAARARLAGSGSISTSRGAGRLRSVKSTSPASLRSESLSTSTQDAARRSSVRASRRRRRTPSSRLLAVAADPAHDASPAAAGARAPARTRPAPRARRRR